ncbi:MAG: hypothetical protein WEB13_06895 [Dehalococcoidia bacterium]
MSTDQRPSFRGGAPAILRYHFPAGFVLRWLISAALRRRRVLAADASVLLRRYPSPTVIGANLLPRETPFVLVLNHYERPGMRMWWTALYAVAVITERRPDVSIAWISTDRFGGWRVWGVPLVPEAAVRWFMRRVAFAYGLLILNPRDVHAAARVLRAAALALRRGHVVGITPEAGNAPGLRRHLRTAWPGSGNAIAWLSRGHVPVVPIALWEDDGGRVVVQVGKARCLDPSERDAPIAAKTNEVMRAVAALLPDELRGPYGANAGDRP